MNQNDSEILAGFLEQAGYQAQARPEGAHVLVVNTCSVRDAAERKAAGQLWELAHIKENSPVTKIIVCGCMASREGEAILRKLPFVDAVVGTRSLHRFGDILQGLERTSGIVDSKVSFPIPDDIDLPVKRAESVQAWVTVMYGCDKFCTYCIVPYTRGREVSRTKESILREIEALDHTQFKEVVLLGQTVDSYGKDLGYGLADLLAWVNDVPGVERIRFLTSYPRDLCYELIGAVRDLPNVCEYIHLPVQHGHDDMLSAMHRGYTIDFYKKLVHKIRDEIPGVAITTDLIVGFPGETDTHFQATLNLLRDLEFDLANVAAYSPRPGTVAAKMENQIPEEIKKERLHALNRVVGEVALHRNKPLVGTLQEVLVEKIEKTVEASRHGGILSGRTRTNKIVHFYADSALYGKLVDVKIDRATAWSLYGTACTTTNH